MINIALNKNSNNFNELSIELTNKCTLNCIYCSSEAHLEKNEYIKLNKIKNVILEVKNNFHIHKISLSGGETFLYPQFLQLFNFLKNNKFEIMIYSSGIILNQNNELSPIDMSILNKMEIKESNLKIILNIQGHNRELIENINGTPESFNILEKSIKNIKRKKIYLGAHIVPFRHNYKNLYDIAEFCWSKSFNELNFLRFVPQGRGRDSSLYNTKSEFAEINQMLVKILKRFKNERNFHIRLGHPINFLFLTEHNHLYLPEEPHHCRGGADAPLIMPNGDVSMCPAWKDLKLFYVGNIYKQDFCEIWSNEKFTLFRNFIERDYKYLSEPCRNCDYIKMCRGKCVAQRLLNQKESIKDRNLKKLIQHAPDPQCFKNKDLLI